MTKYPCDYEKRTFLNSRKMIIYGRCHTHYNATVQILLPYNPADDWLEADDTLRELLQALVATPWDAARSPRPPKSSSEV